MYKYKQTTNVEVGDLVVWTELPPSITNRINNKVYRVTGKTTSNNPIIFDEIGSEKSYGKAHGFKVLHTKPASEAVVGDYMYRITSGSDAFPKHTIVKIIRTGNERLGYSEELGVDFYEVIVIAQAEPEVTYPLFMQSVKNETVLVKFIADTKGTYMINGTYEAGHYSSSWNPHQSESWKPCDFTIQPDIDDIDWWQARYKAGLPVYAIHTNTNTIRRCESVSPKSWGKEYTFSITHPSIVQQAPVSALYNEITLGATTDCSLPNQTTKEQPMKLQQLLDAIFGVSDYEAKPKFIVTVFNNDKEVATTTAYSVEEIQQTIQSDTRLWGCKLVAYKIHSELQTQVPVAITKFKKESNASAE